MSAKKSYLSLIVALSLALIASLAVGAGSPGAEPPAPNSVPLGTAFTYQGRLTDDAGLAVDGTCDFQFSLWDDPAAGAQVGPLLNPTGVAVTKGLFTVALDFGGGAFTGPARWLEIAVRCAGDPGYTPLSPRQPLTPAPYALALPGLWTQQNETSPNLIGGHTDNGVSSGVVGATIGGGGEEGKPNQVTDAWGTVGGGAANHAGDGDADPNNAGGATVGGGRGNTASGSFSAVGGGNTNTASYDNATVGGGAGNTASGLRATVGGGLINTASGEGATVGGGSSNVVTGTFGTISGGIGNTASAGFGTIAGGGWTEWGNPATANRVTDLRGTVGGGGNNQAGDGDANGGNAVGATVAGGEGNTASAPAATVGGGVLNTAGAGQATVGGGGTNTAGGSGATVAGGAANNASSQWATVGGGSDNTASGGSSTVPGGWHNRAEGDFGLAAGRCAVAHHAGAFVWGDATEADVTSSGDNQFIVRANGGLWFGQATTAVTPTIGAGVFISTSTGAYLSTGGTWANASDRNLKANLAPVDGRQVLARLAEVPIATWNYTTQDASVRHMGPTAQDFYAAFGLGDDETHIATVDADGVALAAIQGLYAENQALKVENAAQQAQIDALEARLSALEQAHGTPNAQAGRQPSPLWRAARRPAPRRRRGRPASHARPPMTKL